MKLVLDAYFDRNFGDDYMVRIMLHYLPEAEFIIREKNEFNSFLEKEQNVTFGADAKEQLPRIVVTGSGFMINSPEALKCELVWFIRRKRMGDYCVGCNIEPLHSRLKEFLIRKKLQKFKLVICRDAHSYNWLKKIKGPAVYRLPDILFSIPDEWLPKGKISDKLGISVMHRAGDNEDCAYYRAMADAADHWAESTGKRVFLMAFDTGNENDVWACDNVKRMMKRRDMADIIYHDNNEEILNAYAECEKIIGARFHSGVLAMRMGKAFYPVIFREKMRRLINESCYPVKGCDIDNIDIGEIKRFLDSPSVNIRPDRDMLDSSMQYSVILKREYIKAERK